MTTPPTDLTKRPPRSPRVRLGGYVILPRMIDKGRALVAGTIGDYHYACPLDQRFVEFVGFDTDAFKAEIAQGKGDRELLEWINANVKFKRAPYEIAAWSNYQESRVTTTIEGHNFFSKLHGEMAPKREDIGTWFELLDLDDFVSYGGKA